MTELEKSLLESLNKMAEENEELSEKLEKATDDQKFWYEAYCRLQVKIKELEAVNSDSSNKEGI